MINNRVKRYLPYLLTLLIIAADQISKALIVKYVEEGTVALSLLNGFLWIAHVRNNAVAFSLGTGLGVAFKYIFFVLLPIVVMCIVGYSVSAKRFDSEITYFQRWCLAGILGGGIGNIIDRLFRHLRVVDWVSTAMYGAFGMDRFPTWNLADSAVVISVILLLLSFIIGEFKEKKNGKKG